MDIIEEIRYLMLAVQREGNRQFAELLRPLKLTPSQAEVLVVLSESQPISLIGLGERLVCESGSPSRLVNRMVEAGLVQKVPSPEDKRAVLLSLTDKAQTLLPQLAEIEDAIHGNIAAGLETVPMPAEELAAAFWHFVKDTEVGQALKRRKESLPEE